MSIDLGGIWFWRKGEEICWLYPWKRKQSGGKKYASLDMCGYFNTLKEIDDFWGEYFDAYSKIGNSE